MDEIHQLQERYSILNEKMNNAIKDMSILAKDMEKLIGKMDVFFGSLNNLQAIIDRWVGALRIISLLMVLFMSIFGFFFKREIDQNDFQNQYQSQTIEQLNNRLILAEQQINFIRGK